MYSKPIIDPIPLKNSRIRDQATNTSSLIQTGYFRVMATPERVSKEFFI
jgi:hypothetical protein